MTDRELAAANNAAWCDVVCRTHGLDTTLDEAAWTSRTRTPPFYPDAVTLVAETSIPDLLARVDASGGCSIKDSFASIDLTDFGFHVLFDAEWIVRATSTAQQAVPDWTVVRDQDGFGLWERAWRVGDGDADVLRVDLLDVAEVDVLAGWADGRVVAGAVLNRTPEVVGVSNVFTRSGDASTAWSGCLALAGSLLPGSTIVGYERGDALEAALDQGFKIAGPMRVWLRDM